jgi:GNAT superfamily N-acetyltransferase
VTLATTGAGHHDHDENQAGTDPNPNERTPSGSVQEGRTDDGRAGSIVVRSAQPSDQAAIVEYNLRLASETEGKTLDPAVLERGVAQAIADPDRLRYWVAEIHEAPRSRIVGQAAITREWSDWRAGWLWWFQSVYVHPDYRGRGVFRSLHGAIRSEAIAAPDVIGLRLYVEQDNETAQRTYRSLGLRPGGYHVFEELWIGPIDLDQRATGPREPGR